MKKHASKILFFFSVHTAVVMVLLFLFYWIIRFCFLPLGFMLTVFGYLMNVISLLVISCSSGMIAAFLVGRSHIKTGNILWIIPLFNLSTLFALRYFFSNSWDYTLLLFLSGLLLALFFGYTGLKSLKARS